MMKPLLAAIAAASFVALGACTQETRVEEEPTTEQAMEDVGNELEQAGNELEQAAENAGNELEQAGQNAENAAERATDGDPATNP